MTARVTYSTMANNAIHHVGHVLEDERRSYRVCRVVEQTDDGDATHDFNAETGKAEAWLKGNR